MTTREQLNSIAEERVIILDGAMGSLIQVLNLDEKSFRGEQFAGHPVPLTGCNDVLCLTRPGAIGAIHDTYLEAGADIIETCSFNATSTVLADYGLERLAYDISKAAAEIARKSADKFAHSKPRFVAGSIGPTSKGASLYPDVNDPGKRSIGWDELEAAYYDNARGLLDGGADLLLVETIFDTLNAKAALFAINKILEERNIDIPVMISASISGEGQAIGSGRLYRDARLLSGQGLEAFLISVQHAKPWAIGLNCSFNAPKLLPHLQVLSDIAPCLISAYPNAGLPNQFGRYDEMPDIMSANIEPFIKDGLINVIGGCCGSSPAHIAAIADAAQKYAPRKIPTDFGVKFSGLEPLCIENKTVRLNNDENPKDREDFLNALSNGEYEDAADIARDMVESGCAILNIETDDEKTLSSFLDYALMNPYIAKAPFYINSRDFNVLQAGLKRIQGRGFAGPVNLKDGETEFLRKAKLIRQYGAAVVIAPEDAQKIETAQKAYHLLKENGFSVNDIVMTNTGDSRIKDNCPDALIAI